MHHFVLFSVILIAASVIVLLIPSTLDEGFKNNSPRLIKQTAPNNRAMGHSNPTAAGQRNSSSTAGAADGSSNNQHLMDILLKKQDIIAEAFENRDEQSFLNFNKLDDTNCIWGRIHTPRVTNDTYSYLGDFNSYEECARSTNIPPNAKAITYHNESHGGGWAKQCYSINDTTTTVAEKNTTCGIVVSTPPPAPPPPPPPAAAPVPDIVTSTAADEGDNVPIPVAGCNMDVCMKIDPKAVDPQGIPIAFQGNCINPKYKGSRSVNYGIKYCPAFQSKYDVYDQECQTCGYYEYKGICRRKDPNKDPDPPGFVPTPVNPSNCDYESYESPDGVTMGAIPGTQGSQGSQGSKSSLDPSCSTCKLIQRVDRCVIPECHSTDGYLPFPDDEGYNFAEGCFYYNPSKENTRPGMQGRSPGYYCPPITQGQSYDGGGNSGDPCYTTNGALSFAKYVRMNKACSNDKAKSNQNFVPGKDAPIDANYTTTASKTSATASKTSATASKATASKATASTATASKTSATASTINHVHHVYHHEVDSNNSNSNTNNNGCSYMEPVPGAGILGF